MRVYEIAKEVGIPNKDLIAKIRALGLEVNNHMSSLDADDVARIKRSLEKEKGAPAPQQTSKLSSGTVLRRRSSGDKDGDDAPAPHAKAATPSAPAPVVRRRAEAAPAPVSTPVEPPKPVEKPIVRAQAPKEEPKLESSAPAPRPAPVEVAPPPVTVKAPTPPPVVVAEKKQEPARVAVETAAPVRPPVVEAKPGPTPVAKPPVVTPPPRPAAVTATAGAQAAPVVPTPPSPPQRSRVIVAGPQVVSRTSSESSTHGGQRIVDVQPPPSTPLPPRVTPVRPTNAPQNAPQQAHGNNGNGDTQQQPPDARSRFELELERARARTEGKPRIIDIDMTQPRNNGSMGTATEATEPAPSSSSPRDPLRPAVGTVIALPPRIKITERTPISGRPAPGPQPVNPIRGRFAQQQQRGGRPGGPHGGHGRHDMKKLPLGKKGKQTTITTPAEHKRIVRIEDTISVSELARSMGVKAPEVLKKLWGMGMTGVNINASIDFDTSQLLASEFGYEVQNVAFKEEEAFTQKSEDVGELVARSPVVTIMGHVDHGKTTLLDTIRKTRVAAGEAGGITQHVAAYKVAVPGHGDIVFLDTPGHEAFTEMRARGAQATDIVVLVVAANDGVMPQTVEALNHALDAKVTIIVAVNKIDLPDAAPERVKQQLSDKGLIPEEWGGTTIFVNVSAIKGDNVDKLLEAIALTAEVMELRADPNKSASGLVIEARLDRNR
ncbi:MAG TPA: translation initiation factor IF-2 N-terminal domain-containing protein, partial [Kofleriaceae bacterium]